MASKIDFLIIDPQDSFCAVVDPKDQQRLHRGELSVPGAWDAMERVGETINKGSSKINDISVTLDSHRNFHIGNVTWFKDSAGNNPPPFTIMRVENGKIMGSVFDPQLGKMKEVGEFTTFVPSKLQSTKNYIEALAKSNRYPHCCWPPHCLIGTIGASIIAPVYDALLNWEKTVKGEVNYLTKGSNADVEHFGAVRAEVPDPSDPSTQLNTDFIQSLDKADLVVVSGIAGSHCLANTVRDIANSFSDNKWISKVALLEDGTAPVPGFEHLQNDFIKDMKSRGMQVMKCKDLF